MRATLVVLIAPEFGASGDVVNRVEMRASALNPRRSAFATDAVEKSGDFRPRGSDREPWQAKQCRWAGVRLDDVEPGYCTIARAQLDEECATRRMAEQRKGGGRSRRHGWSLKLMDAGFGAAKAKREKKEGDRQ